MTLRVHKVNGTGLIVCQVSCYIGAVYRLHLSFELYLFEAFFCKEDKEITRAKFRVCVLIHHRSVGLPFVTRA